MKLLLVTLSLIGMVGCGQKATKEETVVANENAGASDKRFRSTGLKGVYLVDTTDAQSVFDNYGIEHELIAEILSDKPLVFSLTEGDEEPEWKSGNLPEAAVYQYFVYLTYSQDASVVKSKCGVRVVTSDKIALSDALKMKPHESIDTGVSMRSFWGKNITIPPLSTDLVPSGRKAGSLLSASPSLKLEEGGVVSIWQFQRVIAPVDPAEKPFFSAQQGILSLDIRTVPNSQQETAELHPLNPGRTDVPIRTP